VLATAEHATELTTLRTLTSIVVGIYFRSSALPKSSNYLVVFILSCISCGRIACLSLLLPKTVTIDIMDITNT